jgi:large subunit ribosomal protein L21
MYAIIADSGRQIKVQAGEIVTIDFRENATTGEKLIFGKVLAVGGGDGGLKFGTGPLDGVSVEAEVVGVKLGEKLTVQKFRKRKNSKRRTGHRQLFTQVKIGEIKG